MNESTLLATASGLALKTTAILAAARIATWLLRRRSAAARHQIWTAASAAVIALPLLSLSLPAWRPQATAALAPVLLEITTTASATSPTPTQPNVSTASAPSVPRSAAAPWRPDLRRASLFLWLTGSLTMLLPMLYAALRLRLVRRNARPSPFRDLCGELARELEISRTVSLLETRSGSMPMTLGTLRPVIFLPSDAGQWTEDRRRMVLLHELAHVRRGDVAMQYLSRIALTLNWWNPLAWTAWRESLTERERAADDLVLRAGARASDYAGHLLEIARSLRTAPLGAAAVCMARRPQLEGRLLAILDSHTNRKSAGRTFAFATTITAVAFVAPLAALHAQAPAAISPDVSATVRSAVAQNNSEMLDQPAQAFADKHDFDTARALLDTAANIRAGVSGTGSVNYGVGLMKIADLEARRKNTSEAIAFYAKAVQVLGSRPEAAPAFIYLGIRSLGAKNYDQATTYLESAKALATPVAGAAAMWLGVVKERQDNPSGAEAMYQEALALQGSNPGDAALTMRLYGLFLARKGRTIESQALADRAAAYHPPVESLVQSGLSVAVRPGNGVGLPKLEKKVEPSYAEEARFAKLQGSVTLTLVVGADGIPTNIQVVKSLGLGLDQSAIDAVSAWVFKPGMKDGSPVAVIANVEVNFRLL